MTLIYPATADAFRCIADACRHTCCKGWEIDIDPDTRVKSGSGCATRLRTRRTVLLSACGRMNVARC